MNNFASRDACFRCHVPKPAAFSGVAAYGAPAAATAAGYESFYGAAPGGGYGGAPPAGRGGGGGEQREGDWPCPQCQVNNYASRTECFRCTAPKPGGGYGGGGGGKYTSNLPLLVISRNIFLTDCL